MTGAPRKWDLLILTTDKDTQCALEGLFSRPQALGIRPNLARAILVHPRRDPGVFREAHTFLRPFLNQASYCLVVFDREGCGGTKKREALEGMVQQNLDGNGWIDRSAVVTIDPELEIWLWADSPEVDRALGWPAKGHSLREWLVQSGFLEPGRTKPDRPKEALEAALARTRTGRSSALYRGLASRVSFQRCTDPAFRKLLDLLARWFPAPGQPET